jgi:hypothetical protein
MLYPVLINYFLILIISLVIFYSFGWALKKIFKVETGNNFLQNIFINILIGIVFLTSIYSVFQAQLITILSINFLLFLILLYYYRSSYNKNSIPLLEKPFRFFIIPLLIILVFSFGLSIVFSIDLSGFPIVVTRGYDYAYYSQISKSLGDTGIENYFTTEKYLSGKYNYVVPYHYFDLWLCDMISRISNSNHYLVSAFVVQSIYCFLSIIGLLSILLTKHTVYSSLVVSILLLACGRIFFPFYEYIIYLSDKYYGNSIFGEPPFVAPNKLLFFYPFAIASGISVLKNKYQIGFLILLFLGLMYVTTLPAIIFSIVALIIINYFKNWWDKKISFTLIIGVLISTLFYGGFYWYYGNSSKSLYELKSFELLNSVFLKTRINIIIVTMFQFIVIFSPVAIFFYIFYRITVIGRNNSRIILYFSVFSIIAGLGIWILIFQMTDSTQFLSNNVSIISALVMVWLAFFLTQIDTAKYSYKYLILVFIILLGSRWVYIFSNGFDQKNYFKSVYSDQYISLVIGKSKSLPINSVGGFFKTPVDYVKYAEKTSFSYTLSLFHCLSNNLLPSINLSETEIPLSKDSLMIVREKRIIHQHIFYQYHDSLSNINPNQSITESQLSFINQYHLKYLVCTAAVKLDPRIESLIIDSVIDKKSKERFYILK